MDEHRNRLEEERKQLELERQKFTEAAIKIGKERAQLMVALCK